MQVIDRTKVVTFVDKIILIFKIQHCINTNRTKIYSECLFLYGPFFDGALVLDLSTLFATQIRQPSSVLSTVIRKRKLNYTRARFVYHLNGVFALRMCSSTKLNYPPFSTLAFVCVIRFITNRKYAFVCIY